MNEMKDGIGAEVDSGDENEAVLTMMKPQNWRGLYPWLKTIEVVRQEWRPLCDPYLRFKAYNQFHNESFFVAGYSTGDFFEDERFFGLLVHHDTQEMEWAEYHGSMFQTDGPGSLPFDVDRSWKARRFSYLAKEYPSYRFIAEERLTLHPRYPVVTALSLGELKAYLARAEDIDTVALVGHYFDVRIAGEFLRMTNIGFGKYHEAEREKTALELAESGQLRVAVKDLAEVPEAWRPFALSLDELPDDQACQVEYARGRYYVRLWERILPPGRGRE